MSKKNETSSFTLVFLAVAAVVLLVATLLGVRAMSREELAKQETVEALEFFEVGDRASDSEEYVDRPEPTMPSDYNGPRSSVSSKAVNPFSEDELFWGLSMRDVWEIQTSLGIEADGKFGEDTDAAVRVFQQENGLTVDGIVGPNTAKLLGLNLDGSYCFRPLAGEGTDIRLALNKDAFSLTAYEFSDGQWTVLRRMNVAIGANNKTPSGTYKIVGRYSGFEKNGYWWANMVVFDLERELGFHSVPFQNGKCVDDRVGCAISNGCVRLLREDSDWLYANIPDGSTVKIF